MTTRLILVEGLPGSGKSTTAKMIYEMLNDKGICAELYSEGNLDHPADYDGVAYFDEFAFHKLEQQHAIPDKIKIIHQRGFLIPYRKAIEEWNLELEPELVDELVQKDIYELPIDLHMELIANRWQQFADNQIGMDTVVVFECCFIQNPVTVTMIRNGLSKELTMDYVNRLARIIEPLRPTLVYVNQDSIQDSFQKAIQERPQQWFDGFADYYTCQGYGRNNNLKGLDGVLQVLEERSKLESEIFDLLKTAKFKINNTSFDKDLLKKQLQVVLEQV